MPETKDTHKHVEKFYADAVEKKSDGCGCAPDCCIPDPKGVAAKVAGYDPDELAKLPADAVENSFGCGNPLAFAGVGAGETVLDLGSGAGIDLLLAAGLVGPEGRVIGVDMTDAMIERARENIAASGYGNVEVRKGLIEEMPVEDGSVDWVISNCVINLSPEKHRVFAEIARVLKPGGTMRVSDIVVEDMPEWLRESETLYNTCIAGAISEKDYLAGLREAGLADAEVIERLHYEGSQLEAFILSELPEGDAVLASFEGMSRQEAVTKIARDMAGKVWSAKIQARRT